MQLGEEAKVGVILAVLFRGTLPSFAKHKVVPDGPSIVGVPQDLRVARRPNFGYDEGASPYPERSVS